MTFEKEYAAAIRDLVARNGTPVRRDRSIYGWEDADAYEHCLQIPAGSQYIEPDPSLFAQCHWIVPEGVFMTEEVYTEFAGTFADADDDRHGINLASTEAASIHCACGKFTGVTLRYEATLSDMLSQLFGRDARQPGWTL